MNLLNISSLTLSNKERLIKIFQINSIIDLDYSFNYQILPIKKKIFYK